MGIQKYLRMQNVLQTTILSAEFISIPTNNKSDKAVMYIHDITSWERCYVLLNILFPCLRSIFLADINREEMEKVYYYSRMTKQCIEKKSLILMIRKYSQTYRHQTIYGTSKIYKSDEEDSTSNDFTEYSDIYVLSYESSGITERKISILIML